MNACTSVIGLYFDYKTRNIAIIFVCVNDYISTASCILEFVEKFEVVDSLLI